MLSGWSVRGHSVITLKMFNQQVLWEKIRDAWSQIQTTWVINKVFMTNGMKRQNTMHKIFLIPCNGLVQAFLSAHCSVIIWVFISQILQMVYNPKSWVWYKQDLTQPWHKHLVRLQSLAASENKSSMRISCLRRKLFLFIFEQKGKSK